MQIVQINSLFGQSKNESSYCVKGKMKFSIEHKQLIHWLQYSAAAGGDRLFTTLT